MLVDLVRQCRDHAMQSMGGIMDIDERKFRFEAADGASIAAYRWRRRA